MQVNEYLRLHNLEAILADAVNDAVTARAADPVSFIADALSKLEHEEVTLPPRYVSTYKNDFIAKDLPPSETLGRKVMMTQNMVGIKGAGDGLYRKETGIIPANRFPESAEPCPMGQTFTMTGLKPSRGFGLNTAFSQPIAEYTKGEEKD